MAGRAERLCRTSPAAMKADPTRGGQVKSVTIRVLLGLHLLSMPFGMCPSIATVDRVYKFLLRLQKDDDGERGADEGRTTRKSV